VEEPNNLGRREKPNGWIEVVDRKKLSGGRAIPKCIIWGPGTRDGKKLTRKNYELFERILEHRLWMLLDRIGGREPYEVSDFIDKRSDFKQAKKFCGIVRHEQDKICTLLEKWIREEGLEIATQKYAKLMEN